MYLRSPSAEVKTDFSYTCIPS